MANDTGSNYFFIPGGEAPAPPVAPPPVTEPVSPFERYLMALENLQAPVEFTPSSYQEPSAPAFTPMVAPAAVRVSPASKFGPVTPSGYAQPPVDPLSYYSTPEPTPVEPTPYTGGPTRWTEINRPALETLAPTPMPVTPAPVTPDLSSVETFNPIPDQPSGGNGGNGSSQPSTPSAPSTPPSQGPQTPYSTDEVFPGFEGLRLGDPVPGMPGTKIGDVIKDDSGNVWNWREGRWDLAKITVNPLPETSLPKVEDVNTNIFSGVVTNPVQGGEKPYYIEDTGVAGPAIESKPITPGLIPLDKPQFTLQPTTSFPSTTTRNPIVLPGASVLSRPVTTTALPELPVNPVPVNPELTRNREMIPSRYFRDINYDPEEILAAAMRSMGGRMARRSILNELS